MDNLIISFINKLIKTKAARYLTYPFSRNPNRNYNPPIIYLLIAESSALEQATKLVSGELPHVMNYISLVNVCCCSFVFEIIFKINKLLSS